MNSSKALEMLIEGRIEDLKASLQDEIYTESLKSKSGAKKRYSAMKRYLKTISETREILTKPCAVNIDGVDYNSFCNTYSLALTKEPCGEIEMCAEPGRYPDVSRLIPSDGEEGKIDFNKVLAEAKSKGYKYTKNAIHSNEYLMRYKGGYFRLALVDVTYGILDEGKEVDVLFNGKLRPITILNDLGKAIVLPIRYDGEHPDAKVIVEVE